jgi:hypothetical protein
LLEMLLLMVNSFRVVIKTMMKILLFILHNNDGWKGHSLL